MNEYIDDAVETFASETEEPMSLAEFVDVVVEDPSGIRSSAEYLLDAIEYYGTRSVVEYGIERERYRFFDDPANDGEHAILGHTQLLNDFVEDLRQRAHGEANEETIFWFNGPTATGKSELKRCLINGIEAYSKTDEGKRYTVEWSMDSATETPSSMTYGSGRGGTSREWFQSPVQSNPLTVLPENVRRRVVEDSGVSNGDFLSNVGMDPFSKEAVELLEEEYGHDPDAYDEILSDDHCRVIRYTMEMGRGIGVLQSEDGGQPRHKLVGKWMSGVVKDLDSRGRRNPQAFSYDGVLSQGNAGLCVIEDAAEHYEMLMKMLNVVDDNVAKIDRRSRLPLDTVYMLISNPGLQAKLNERYETERGVHDPSRAMRRRLSRHDLGYLVSYTDEAELLHRLLTGQTEVWEDGDDEKVSQPVELNGVELAPHVLEGVAMYEVISRMKVDDIPAKIADMQLVDRAILYDEGEVEEKGVRYEISESKSRGLSTNDGLSGIPCTYTRDVLADVVAESDQDVVMPEEAIEMLEDRAGQYAVFSEQEVDHISSLVDDALLYVFDQQESDMLSAMLRDEVPTDDEVEEYVEHVYSWGTEEDTVEPDTAIMRVFETNYLGFSDSEYDNGPSDAVEQFRRDEVITGVSTWIYDQSEDYEIDLDDVPMSEIPALEDVIEDRSWDDVQRIYDNFEFEQWSDPLDGTQTEEVKKRTIENMVDMFDYSEESARRTAISVINELTGPGIDEMEYSAPGGDDDGN